MVWLGCAAQGGGAAWAGVRGVRDIRTGEEHGERVLHKKTVQKSINGF